MIPHLGKQKFRDTAMTTSISQKQKCLDHNMAHQNIPQPVNVLELVNLETEQPKL
jgi:hypothetical protein